MNADVHVCPFCNGLLPALSTSPSAGKLPCPRCGELIAASRWQVDTAIASGEPKLTTHTGAADRPDTTRQNVPGIRKTALIVLGIMLSMAVVGLSYMLWTREFRRSLDPKGSLDPVTYRKPLELEGLGYLPKDSDIIVGLQIAEWLADKKVGKPLLDEPRPAVLDWVMKQLPRVTGMPLEELDHVVLAASFDTPQVVMVVKTRRPIAPEKIAEHAKPSKAPSHQDKPLYEISFNPPVEALVWCVGAKTLLLVLRFDAPKREHLNGLSATPRRIEEIVYAPLREALKERLPKYQLLWAAGRLDRLGMLKDMLALVPAVKPYLEATKDLKTFAIGLEPVEGLTLTGHFQMTDAKAAAKFKSFLEGVKIDGAQSQKVVAPPADEKEQWMIWQVRGDVTVMREFMNRGKNGKK
jgi:hypothetical protein